MAMTESEVSNILLVRAFEECDKNIFSEGEKRNAFLKAGEHIDKDWFIRRASYLIDTLSKQNQAIQGIIKFPGRIFLIFCFFAFIIGVASNYLGPSGKIHVLFYPLLIIIGWNIFIYLTLILSLFKSLFNKKKYFGKFGKPQQSFPPGEEADFFPQASSKARKNYPKLSWVLRIFFPVFWSIFHQFFYSVSRGKRHAMKNINISRKFWEYWWEATSPVLILKGIRFLHWGSIFLTLGVISGIYLRGLFFEYNVVWSSTFIRNENAIEWIVKFIYAPAMLFSDFFGLGLNYEFQVTDLTSLNGIPAAPWLHLNFIMAFVIILIPRFSLVFFETTKINYLKNKIKINFDSYYEKIVGPQLKDNFEEKARIACAKFSEGLAEFVCIKLYDTKIVPRIESFRNNGGKISDLKKEIIDICERFKPDLESYIKKIGIVEFEDSMKNFVDNTIGDIQKDFTIERATAKEDWVEMHDKGTGGVIGNSVEAIGDSFSNIIGAAVAGSIAMVTGTLSGGFGAEVGIAIISAVSGPIGFVIGAIGGLLLAGAGYFLGREKITGAIENIDFPGMVLRNILYKSKFEKIIEDGRTKTRESVKKQIQEKMDPLIKRISENLRLKVISALNQ